MSAWTTAQLDTIRELGHLGVQAVHDALVERYGAEHSLRAIEVQASRIHASLRVLTECPECHALGVHINRQSGMCPRCTEAAHVAEEEAFNELLVAEAAGCDAGPEYEELHRRWATLRQQNSRLMRAHGLRGKRERSL